MSSATNSDKKSAIKKAAPAAATTDADADADSDGSGSGSGGEEEAPILLGVVENPKNRIFLQPRFFPSKVGGKPVCVCLDRRRQCQSVWCGPDLMSGGFMV